MKQTIPIIGMACAMCAGNVERKLRSLPGISSVSVSLAGRTAFVDYDPATITLQQMKQEISAIGYDMVIEADRSADEINKAAFRLLRRRTILSWLFSLLIMSLSMGWISLEAGGAEGCSANGQMAMDQSSLANQTCLILSLLNIILCGRPFYASAVRQLRHLTANMDSLVALSTAVTFLFSAFNTFFGEKLWGALGMDWHTYFDASAMIISFVLTGRCLEERAKDSTAASLRQLMGMQPKTARVVSGREVNEVPVSAIERGDILEVRAGERIPVDGTVTLAESFMTADAAYVDEAMITGEPTPAAKRTGDTVLAGTIPSQGKLRLRASATGEQTALSQIISRVQEAQASKAPVERIVDKASRVFVPTVALLSLLTFVAWWIAGGTAALPRAVMSAVSVMVIACPCAMGLATPTALMVGIGKAARRQILIKDAAALEMLRRVDAVVIDKTGTLTIPNPAIDFTTSDNLPPEQREQLKPNAAEAIEELHRRGIAVYLMSGDNDVAVAYWAARAGIHNWRSKVKPTDKETLVAELQQRGHCVAMVGDGINDTQALALADAGIAIGRGTDVAMDVAQVTLMGDDLLSLPRAFNISRRTVRMIWQNLFLAFVYNIVCIPLAAGALSIFGINLQITPMWASALMACSSISVVCNSLRLNFERAEHRTN